MWNATDNVGEAAKKNEAAIKALSSTSYPLAPTGDPAEVTMPQTPSQKGTIQGHFPHLKGEHEAEHMAGSQR
jgi:hypothetical protein